MLGHLAGFGGFSVWKYSLMRNPAVLGGSSTGYGASLRRLCPHRRQERLDAEDVHDAREIVGQHV